MHGSELWNERVGGCEKSASAACAASLLLYLYADLMATNSSRLGVALRRRRTHRLVAVVQHKALRQMKPGTTAAGGPEDREPTLHRTTYVWLSRLHAQNLNTCAKCPTISTRINTSSQLSKETTHLVLSVPEVLQDPRQRALLHSLLLASHGSDLSGRTCTRAQSAISKEGITQMTYHTRRSSPSPPGSPAEGAA